MGVNNKIARIAICAAVFGIFDVAMAVAEDWEVVRSSGLVERMTEAGEWIATERGEHILIGDSVRTGQHGRVKLQRGEQVIQIRPNSIVRIPDQDELSDETSIHHLVGTARYTVDRDEAPHFSVQTPYLAAVVKGTMFEVEIDDDESSVAVRSGTDEVSDYDTGEPDEVFLDNYFDDEGHVDDTDQGDDQEDET